MRTGYVTLASSYYGKYQNNLVAQVEVSTTFFLWAKVRIIALYDGSRELERCRYSQWFWIRKKRIELYQDNGVTPHGV